MKTPTTQVRYLTDAAVEITTPDGIVLIDLSEYTPNELISEGIVAAVSSHQHSDHCDRPRLAKLDVPVWAPADTVTLLDSEGVTQSHSLVVRAPMHVTDSLTVTALPVCHGPNAKPIMNYGLIIEVNGHRIWHTGDLGVDSEPHPNGAFDLVVICVGGTYVFGPEEACTYLDRLGHEGPALGVHFDYDQPMGERFLEAGRNAAWTPVLLESGETYLLGGK